MAPTHGSPQDIVSRLVAIQAQDYYAGLWSVGMRLRDGREVQIERAYNDGHILRTHVLRPTWHFVTPADIGWLLRLTGPRVQAASAYRHRQLGLARADFRRSHQAMARALEGGHFRTRAELGDALKHAGVSDPAGQRLAYLVMAAELDGLVCSGPRRGRQFTYALLSERVPHTRHLDREEALAELARRYFTTRGPASVSDFAGWSGLTLSDARLGLLAVQADLEHDQVDGKEMWFAPGPLPSAGRARRALLLSLFDEYLSSYKDRRAMIDEDRHAWLWRQGNAIRYVLVIDGQLAGTWSRRLDRASVEIAIRPFESLPPAAERAAAKTARRYADFVGLQPVLG